MLKYFETELQTTAVDLSDRFDKDFKAACQYLLEEKFKEYNVFFDFLVDVLGEEKVMYRINEFMEQLSESDKQQIADYKKKIRYAAPNVIIDDILSGKYIPPIEFIDAVLTGPTFDSEEYQEFYLNYSEKNFWGENEENFEKIAKVLELAGDFEGFKDYILNNNLINIVVPEGSLLNYAITEGKEKEALWLIENGIDINAFDGLELMTAIKKNNNIIAKKLIDEGIVINSREMNDNPLVSAIRFSNAFLVEELMKNYRDLIVAYSNEYVRNCSILDIAERTKNEKIINIVKKYLV